MEEARSCLAATLDFLVRESSFWSDYFLWSKSPADGFFEWSRRGDSKRPFYFHMRDGEPFAIAGLWERWEGVDGPLETCTLLTTEANELLASYHDRMPVILRPEDYELWLNGGASQPELTPLLQPYPHEEMAAYAVSSFVNSPSNDTPRCMEPISALARSDCRR